MWLIFVLAAISIGYAYFPISFSNGKIASVDYITTNHEFNAVIMIEFAEEQLAYHNMRKSFIQNPKRLFYQSKFILQVPSSSLLPSINPSDRTKTIFFGGNTDNHIKHTFQ